MNSSIIWDYTVKLDYIYNTYPEYTKKTWIIQVTPPSSSYFITMHEGVFFGYDICLSCRKCMFVWKQIMSLGVQVLDNISPVKLLQAATNFCCSAIRFIYIYIYMYVYNHLISCFND